MVLKVLATIHSKKGTKCDTPRKEKKSINKKANKIKEKKEQKEKEKEKPEQESEDDTGDGAYDRYDQSITCQIFPLKSSSTCRRK
jgi:hypothetical protein